MYEFGNKEEKYSHTMKGTPMPSTVQELFNTAIQLPLDMQSLLAEKLVGHIETHIDPSLEKLHLSLAKRRRDEVTSGNVSTINGGEALQRVRKNVAG
jgi:hypothetical protein